MNTYKNALFPLISLIQTLHFWIPNSPFHCIPKLLSSIQINISYPNMCCAWNTLFINILLFFVCASLISWYTVYAECTWSYDQGTTDVRVAPPLNIMWSMESSSVIGRNVLKKKKSYFINIQMTLFSIVPINLETSTISIAHIAEVLSFQSICHLSPAKMDKSGWSQALTHRLWRM